MNTHKNIRIGEPTHVSFPMELIAQRFNLPINSPAPEAVKPSVPAPAQQTLPGFSTDQQVTSRAIETGIKKIQRNKWKKRRS